MEIKRKPKFRVIVKDIDAGNVLVNTVYEDPKNKNITLEKFVNLLIDKIAEI
jgi:hypothetical protein